MKRIFAILIAVLVCTMLLVACSSTTESQPQNEDEKETTQSSSDTKDKKTELSVAFWGDKSEIETKLGLLDEYQNLNEDIEIKETYTDGGTYQTKLQVWFSSNTAPDVMGTAIDLIHPYKDMDLIEDLTPYMEKDNMIDGGVWEQSAIEAFTYDGKILSAPYVYKSLAIVYNKTLFDQAEVPYPTEDWTEEDLIEKARKLTVGSGVDKQWGIRLSTFPTNFYRDMFGDPVYLISDYKMNALGNEKFEYSFELLSSMVKEGLSPNETFENTLSAGFESGKFAMAITAPWDMETFDELIGDSFEWDVVKLPYNTKFDTPWRGYLFADGFAMSSNCTSKDEAWEFIKWMTADYEAQKASASVGVPMLTKYANSDEYLNEHTTNTKYNKKAFVDMLENSVGGATTGVWAEINDELNNQFQLVIEGQIDVETAIKQVQEKGEQLLENSKK